MISCGKIFDWENIRLKVAGQDWARATCEALKQGFEGFRDTWDKEPPFEDTGWSHNYFCPGCATRLVMDFHSPHKHSCASCGEIYSGEPYDGAWRKFIHGSIVLNMERAAILANLYPENKSYAEYIRKYILFYAQNYPMYKIHGQHAGKGKVFPQCLTEAIFIIDIERIIRMVSGLKLFSLQELNVVGENLFRPAVELLKPQISSIHNIHAWMNGAVAAAANFLEDRKLMEFAIDGEFGWLNQVERGVTEDGFWYEVSPTYHYYTVSALLSLAWVALENGRNLFVHPRFRKMFDAPLMIAYPNGELPAYNDSWYGRRLSDNSPIYEQLSGIYPDMANILPVFYSESQTGLCGHISNIPNQYFTPATTFSRNSTAALLFGPPTLSGGDFIVKGSRAFKGTGIGILENDRLRAGLKFSNHGGGHDHYDKLAIDVYAFNEQISADFGTSGYGTPLTRKWSRTSTAHNMVVINHETQKAGNAKLLYLDEGKIAAQTCEAYPGKLLKRTLELIEDGFSDCFEVISGEEAIIDWVFHCKGDIKASGPDGKELPMQEKAAFVQENGYDQILELKEAVVDSNWSMEWCTPGWQLSLDFEGVQGTQVFKGRCYGASGLEQLGIVIVRRQAAGTVFKSRFSLTEL